MTGGRRYGTGERTDGQRLSEVQAVPAECVTGASFDRALVEFAEAYADQSERDYGALRDAVKAGRVEARQGV